MGRRDHSQDVQYSTEQIIRSRQLRFFYAIRYSNLAGITFPYTYEVPLGFLVDDVIQNVAPLTPYFFNLISVAAERNALVVTVLNRYASYQDYLNYVIAEQFGVSYGYGKTDLKYTRGIPTEQGSVYTVYIAEWSGLPFNLNLAINGLIGASEQIE